MLLLCNLDPKIQGKELDKIQNYKGDKWVVNCLNFYLTIFIYSSGTDTFFKKRFKFYVKIELQ